MNELIPRDIEFIVSHYIGAETFNYHFGQLGDSHRLREFYLVDCELDILPDSPTSQNLLERFVEVLISQPPPNQAKILRAVRGRFSPGDEYTSVERRKKNVCNDLQDY